MTIHVLVADDQALIRAGLVALLNAAPGLAVAGEAADRAQAMTQAATTRPNVALMDIMNARARRRRRYPPHLVRIRRASSSSNRANHLRPGRVRPRRTQGKVHRVSSSRTPRPSGSSMRFKPLPTATS